MFNDVNRNEVLDALGGVTFDVLVVGAGVNGAVAASALSRQGLKVALIDRNDFGAQCSSNSSGLAWGGIKYLESNEYRLVRRLCKSRNRLVDNFPSQVKEVRFYTSIQKKFRWPSWFIYLGSVLYWLMGSGYTRFPRLLFKSNIVKEQPIVDAGKVVGGVEYSDCYLPDGDARFVFGFVNSAVNNNAVVANYVEALTSNKNEVAGLWETSIRDSLLKRTVTVRSRLLINACGPQVDLFNSVLGLETQYKHKLSKGVHLIVPRLLEEEKILTFFASDGRLFFMIPFGGRTCIGTTDTIVESPEVRVSEEDRDFILKNANELLQLEQPLTKDDIISERCGVRPLVVKQGSEQSGDWFKLSRKHEIHSCDKKNYVCIYGGKLTDCINVGEEILTICIAHGLLNDEGMEKWYGEPPREERDRFYRLASKSGLNGIERDSSESIATRWWRLYGERAFELLQAVNENPYLMQRPLPGCPYSQCEFVLMAKYERIQNLEDLLRRRTNIELTQAQSILLSHPAMLSISTLVFGEQGATKLEEYRHGLVSRDTKSKAQANRRIAKKVVGC
ncbi:FAD-dependent oxidoreductase [Aurantivibrio plasticivorans]